MNENRPQADGILNLNKPKDVTSMEMVRMAKRLTRVKHIGHAGTLDPIATGVLPICFGQSTRLMEYLVGESKAYTARIKLGAATDTYDAYGEVVSEQDASSVTREGVLAALPQFIGNVQQKPPMFSALKYQGQRLYDLARAGIEVEREARDVVVHSIMLEEWDLPFLTIAIECGRGFYVRTLAHEIGQALGCGAHMTELVRTRTGPFRIEESLTPEQFEQAVNDATWEDVLMTADTVLLDIGPVIIEPSAEKHLRNGMPIPLRSVGPYTRHMEARRAYTTDGRFLGLVRFDRSENLWKPEKLFNRPFFSRHAPKVVG